jgi:hypothetical protein
MDEGLTDPFEPWNQSRRPEMLEVLQATYTVLEEDGDEGDLVAHLVADHGEAKALRMLALIQITATRLSIARTKTVRAMKGLPGWQQRSGPTCGTVCDECLANTEEDLRKSLGSLGESP